MLCEASVVSLHREPFAEDFPSAIDEMVVELRSLSSRHGEIMSSSTVFEDRDRGLLLVTVRLSNRIRSQKIMGPNMLLSKPAFSLVGEN